MIHTQSDKEQKTQVNINLLKIYPREINPLQLDKIYKHIEYDRFKEELVLTNNMASCSNLTERGLAAIMMMQPIIVIVAKRSKKECFYCIGGIKTLMLAKSLLPQDYKVPAVMLDNLPNDEIVALVCADVLLSSFLYSVTYPSTIGNIFLKCEPDQIASLLTKEMHTKSGFAEKIGFALNSVFPPKQAKERQQ